MLKNLTAVSGTLITFAICKQKVAGSIADAIIFDSKGFYTQSDQSKIIGGAMGIGDFFSSGQYEVMNLLCSDGVSARSLCEDIQRKYNLGVKPMTEFLFFLVVPDIDDFIKFLRS